jgi:antitoxin (DNA-binding transcriptional repressor) of toxin-antitoxin stability system
MSGTPESERDPLPVSTGQGGAHAGAGPGGAGERRRAAARTRDPGRPASRAERSPARRRIGIRELRQHASVYVDLAEKGYTVDITNRGRLVAQLVPARQPGSPLERLIAAGIIEPAEEPGGVGDLEPYPATTARRPAAGQPGATGKHQSAATGKRRSAAKGKRGPEGSE